MKYILTNLVAILCVVAAAYTASIDVKGWGWFLFVALLTTVSWTTTTKTEAEQD